MPGVSIHVVDVAHGVIAAGLEIALFAVKPDAPPQLIAQGRAGANGLLEHPALASTFATGTHRAVFQVGAYYRDRGEPLPRVPFLDVVTYDFGIADPAQHYHLPFKFTPWGYSCFRGGA